MKNFTDEKWEAHSGIDYTVVMRPEECTENASIIIRHENAEIAPLVAAAPELLALLLDSRGGISFDWKQRRDGLLMSLGQ